MITNTRKEIYRAATGAKKTLVKDLKKKRQFSKSNSFLRMDD